MSYRHRKNDQVQHLQNESTCWNHGENGTIDGVHMIVSIKTVWILGFIGVCVCVFCFHKKLLKVFLFHNSMNCFMIESK